ncbi:MULTISPECIES: 30S ribosome-binding factor RbfA [Prochlorococcus]|uniref:Ribosome-binding factor A n=1 Tax=Prochlorococcus marinus (strain SARG / CCMP1375 / SS120) TaxID=167539 RepID=RBFA_PROMA|nr:MULTISPECIES: 30S ribosome-binding factor RbfA [Prochlorococcus]Q7VE81.1 RecName: Full=Ribosome-binding factor A [Prochlorococcus marinus subsp. marinus str. CCMP1375]AAP99178.1 Ribosome-binding factor A [Prochlorococcus marinus subsp. marinus str. CCMP1375]KGG11553.1 Ribosome-binding factor A [Prochlorococcus marinus str. LG]KGG18493.1 Ribosome-binding factor A [Prochlorococcus marinus str. SS2]KGG22766.1 Ribosome-binding factor A [Prochlorococcus marinus str. SS35]KGG32643.1 Ribosome-bin
MAQSRRVEKVAALIRKEMSELLSNGIRDQRVNTTMITITEVEVSGDLQHCKIFVSIYGNEIQKDEVFSGLEASQSFLKGELGRRLQMRRAPEVVFKLDRGMEKGISVLNLLEKLEAERNIKDKKLIEFQE